MKSRECGPDMDGCRSSPRRLSIQCNMKQSGHISEITSVSEQYVCLLKKLYNDQRATVLTDVGSDEFGIAR